MLVFIQNLIIRTNLSNYNITIVSIKAEFAIDITKANNYEKKDLYIYQCFIKKLIYFIYRIGLNITFTIN